MSAIVDGLEFPVRRVAAWTSAAIVATATFAALAAPVPARAADTVETWDVGASDLDLYFGTDGVRGDEPAVFGELMLGYGLVEGLSAYLGVTMAGDATLGEGAEEVGLGVFGTVVDTDHFDADVFLDLRRTDGLQIAPAVELNLDAAPDLAAWGAFLRLGVPIYGRVRPAGDGVDEPRHERTYHVEINPGLYCTVDEGHQLFAEYDMAYHPDNPRPNDSRPEGARRAEIGGVALGWNVALNDALELINQVSWDVPQAGERAAFGVMTGLIATLPSPGARPAL